MTQRIDDTCSYDELIYVLSHDLRAPARALRQYVLLLKEEANEALNPDARRFMSRLDQVLDRMDAKLDAILQLSRFGRPHGDLEDVDIGALVAEALCARGIESAVGVVPAVRADRERICWLVGELAANVLHHAAGAAVSFDFDGERFWFRDSGPGIPEHIAPEVFMVFRPVPHPDTPHLGMGLSCCSRIVRSLGGSIGVVCPDGGGTHVHFQLPLAG